MAHFSGGAAGPLTQVFPAPRKRWVRVSIRTNDGTLVGSLRLPRGRCALEELIDDGRAYLAIWDVEAGGSPQREEFMVLHKSTIHFVDLLGEAEAPVHFEEA